jgi:20S proteasome subunit alpha 5
MKRDPNCESDHKDAIDNSYHTDPSGTFTRYDAKAIGSGSDAAQQELQDSYHKVRPHLSRKADPR